MATIQEIYEKKGLEYKPLPTDISGITSTQKVFAEIQAKRETQKKVKKLESMIEETEMAYDEAKKAAGWKRMVVETMKGFPEATPKMFKTLATPGGVMAMGRGLPKGLALGYLNDVLKTPEEANEVERAIEEGWEIAGFMGTFLSAEQAMSLAFKSPVIVSKLGICAPYIARMSTWVGINQLHKEMRGASFEERAKQAGIDAVIWFAAEGLSYGIGKAIGRIKPVKVLKPAITEHTLSDISGMAKMNKQIGIAKKIKNIKLPKYVKTIEELESIIKKSLTSSELKIANKWINFRFNQLKAMRTPKIWMEVRDIGKIEPKLEFKITPQSEIKILERLKKAFPGVSEIAGRIEKLKVKIKSVAKPVALITKPVAPTVKPVVVSKIPKKLEPLTKEAKFVREQLKGEDVSKITETEIDKIIAKPIRPGEVEGSIWSIYWSAIKEGGYSKARAKQILLEAIRPIKVIPKKLEPSKAVKEVKPTISKELEPLANWLRKEVEAGRIKNAEEFVTQSIHDIAVKTKTTLETPIRIVVKNWKINKNPSNKFIDLMKEELKTIKPKQYFSLSSFKSKYKSQFTDFYIRATKAVKISKTKAPEAKDLAFFPEKFKRPTAKTVATESEKIIKRSEIARNLAEKLDVPIRRGHYRLGWGRKALGIYKLKPKVIRVKKGGIPVIVHEVGHYLDDILKLSGMVSKTERKKLLMEYGGRPKGEKANKEAFAEFMRFYVTKPSKAKSKAPVYSEYFEKVMEKQPEIKEVLLQTRRDYQRWLEMPAMAKVLSQISMQEAKLGLKQRIITTIEKLYIDLKDEAYPLKQFSYLAKEELGDIPKKELPYILVSILRGWVGKANTFLEKGTFNKIYWEMEATGAKPVFTGKSLKAILKPVERKGALEELKGYLVSKHAIELNKKGIKTGIATKDAKQAIQEALKKYPEFTKVSKEIYKFQDAVLKYGYQSGLFDLETLIRFKKAYKYYVPFFRVQEVLQARGYYGKGYVNISNQLKRMKGSESEIIDVLESIIKNTYAIINASERNAVGIAMANLAARKPVLGRMFEEISAPISKVATVNAKELKISLIGLSRKDAEAVVDIFRPSIFLPNDSVVVVLIKGKKHYFQCRDKIGSADPMLYKALTMTGKEEMGITLSYLTKPTSWLRAGAILTPEFMTRNPQRDMLSAFVFSKYGFLPPIDFIRGLFGLIKKDKDYWLWRMSGGEHSMFVSMDRKYLQKNLDEIIKGKGLKDYVKNPLEALRVLAEMSEIPTRLGEFKRGIAKMKEPPEIGFASREISLDFGKFGTTGKVLNRLIAFWNAWAESMDKIVREFKHHPTRMTVKAVSGLTIPSILLYFVNRDNPHWKETPQWLKDTCWLIPIGDQFPYFVPIRKPFNIGILFATIPERVLQYLDEKDPELIKQLAENILTGQAPGIMPTGLQPLIENWSNYNFFLDRPIVPESRKGLPAEAQYTAYTSEVAKILGKTINYSPAKIDNLFRGYFAGLGNHIIDMVDKVLIGTGVSSIVKPEPTLADKPVIKAFVTRRPIGSASESVNRFYTKYKEYESREMLLKEYLRNNEKEKFYEYKKKFPELYFTYDWERNNFYSIPARYYRSVARDIAELRKKESEIFASKTISPEEKRERIDKINELITKYAQQALEFDIRN